MRYIASTILISILKIFRPKLRILENAPSRLEVRFPAMVWISIPRRQKAGRVQISNRHKVPTPMNSPVADADNKIELVRNGSKYIL